MSHKIPTNFLIAVLIVFCIGCNTLPTVKFDNNNAQNINNIAILGPKQSKDISVNITGDSKLLYLLMGPAIIPQLMMTYGEYSTNKKEAETFSHLIFDVNIEKIFRSKFKDELVANTYFNPILQDDLSTTTGNSKGLDKSQNARSAYTLLASRGDVDTVVELSVFSYGIIDPGLFWAPNVFLTADAKMIRIKDNEIIWQTRIKESMKRKSTRMDYNIYKRNNAELLRYELDAAAEIVAKEMVSNLGFKIKENIAEIRELVSKNVEKNIEEYVKSPAIRRVNINSSKRRITLFP